MLAYAASVPRTAERRSSPNAMLAIVAGHVALLAVVMSANTTLPSRLTRHPIVVAWINPVEPPPPNPVTHNLPRPQQGPTVTRPTALVPPLPGPDVSRVPTVPDPGPVTGPANVSTPGPISIPSPVHLGPELLTAPSE